MTIAGVYLPESMVNALGWMLLHSLWQGFFIVLLYRLIRCFIPPSALKTRYVASLTALLLIPILSFCTFIYLYFGQPHLADIQTHNDQINPVSQQLSVLFQSYDNNAFISQISFRAFFDRLLSFINSHLDLVSSIWMIGMLVFICRFAGGYLYSRHLKSSCVYPVDDTWKNRIEDLRQRMHIRRRVGFYESVKIRIPSVIGFFKPVILIPLGAVAQIPPGQLEAVLVHELTHIYRKDYLVNMIQIFIETIFFFHPAVWWLSVRIRSEREFICDDLSLTYCKDPVTYIKALASLQELSARPPVFAAALATSKNQLLIRIKRMVNPKSLKQENTGGLIMLLFTMALITLTATAALSMKEDPGPDFSLSNLFKEKTYTNPGFQGLMGSNQLFTGSSATEKKPEVFSDNGPAIPDSVRKTDSLTVSQQKALQEYKEALKQQEHARKQMQEAVKERQEALKQQEQALKQMQEAVKERQEALKQQEQARKQMQEVVTEGQEAEKQYREAFRQERDFEHQEYLEALKKAQLKLQELYLPDSLDIKMPHGCRPPRDFYFDFGPGVHFFTWPSDSNFNWNYEKFWESYADSDTSWTNMYEKIDSLTGTFLYDASPFGEEEQEWGEDDFDRFVPFDLKLPDILYNYPELEDLPEIRGFFPPDSPDLRKDDLISPPDAPDLEQRDILHYGGHIDRTESILRSELLKDGIITRGGEYVVYIDSGMMSVNGVRQPREVFKKYRLLLETATGEEIKKGVTYFY
ncbi:MAG: M56 family metallopeptidase [Bacteroidales bacterium]|nr:hypothetical protein [Lentimicrobiaceae bacterium]MDD5694648.1 M56 family metallopeptidase [Bacteroidales bacterium]